MKIALVAQQSSTVASDGTGPDGEDVQLRELSRTLASQGHRVTVYAERPGTRKPDATSRGAGPRPAGHAGQAAGVRIEYVGAGGRPDDSDLLAHVPAFSGPLRERWGKDRPDVVHATRWTSGLAALAATRDLRIPVVQSFQSLGIAERRSALPHTAGTERIRLEPAIGRTASAVVAGSSEVESDLARLGVPRRSINVVPCGVDTSEFAPEGPAAPRGERPRLITVTGLADHEQDSLATLLRALASVPDAELLVAGGPPRAKLTGNQTHRRLSMLADSLDVSRRVSFTGQLSRSALPPLLRSADLFVAAPGCDPSGIATVEAMACGTPVVAPPVGGQVDAVVDGATGILVAPAQPALLAQRIRDLLAHPMLLEGFSVAAADRARHRYSWDRIAQETLAVYGKAVEGAAPVAA